MQAHSTSLAPSASPTDIQLSSLLTLFGDFRGDQQDSLLAIHDGLSSVQEEQAITCDQLRVPVFTACSNPRHPPVYSLLSLLSLRSYPPRNPSPTTFLGFRCCDMTILHTTYRKFLPRSLMFIDVRSGKFVDMSIFLPSPEFAQQVDTCSVDPDGPLSVHMVPRHSRSVIKRYCQWVAVFLAYASVYLRFFPDKAPGALLYLSQITRFAAAHLFSLVAASLSACVNTTAWCI